MNQNDELLDEEMLNEFKLDATDLLEQAEAMLISIEKKNTTFNNEYQKLFNCFHSLKGSLGMFNFEKESHYIHQMEEALNSLDTKEDMPAAYVDYFLKGVTSLQGSLNNGVELIPLVVPNSFESEKNTNKIERDYACKLLVVDDDSVLGEAFQTYYSDDKYHVQVAGTVKEGLELIRNNLDLHTIFCDFHLPDEQGTLVLDTLSSLKITIPVIMMSNAAERSDLISFINKNAFYFVEKSHGFAEFDKALRRALKDRVKKLVYESRLKKTY